MDEDGVDEQGEAAGRQPHLKQGEKPLAFHLSAQGGKTKYIVLYIVLYSVGRAAAGPKDQ